MDALTIQAWYEILSHLDFADAMNGLFIHHRESTEYLVPAHIIRNARRAKRERKLEEERGKVLAITERAKVPENFRQMIAEASPSGVYTPAPEKHEIDLRRAQAQAELRNLSRDLGAMP